MSGWPLRVSIGLGILGCLFALVWLWDARLDDELLQARERERAALGLQRQQAANAAVGTSSAVLIGRPAGGALRPPKPAHEPGSPSPAAPPAPVLPQQQQQPQPQGEVQPQSSASTPTVAPTPPTAPLDARWTVEAGQTLYSIVRRHYGRADRQLLDLVARHNKLADPSQLSAGQLLALPPAP
ncbi:MAG: LysM peptidoglycan-binding domain-containing protein [Planctomycetes bacterium]|nr:LysM peptidoglycan-binding domain-containing protein [Planctomycetota bacterium]